jgi:hypothetical protein
VTRSGPAPESQGEPASDVAEDMHRIQGNLDIFMGPYMLAIARYEPDIAALKKASCRIVPGVGEESRGELAHDGGLGLAKELGMEAVKFPGGHGGFGSHPVEFSKRLEEVLAG